MKRLYLDHHATTPCLPEVVDAMVPYFTEHFGNAGSNQHAWGRRAEVAVKVAREQVAKLIGTQPRNILFTSGATEANNLAILGLVRGLGDGPHHVITVATSHKAVLDPVAHLKDEGVQTTVLGVDRHGRVDPAAVKDALTDHTRLVTLLWANNEVGTLQPVVEIIALCHEAGVLVHVDASQAVGKIPVDVQALGADLMSFTAHKMYGPKGIGALYLRPGRPRVSLQPLQFGGGQERGIRSGTLSVPLIVGFGAACEAAGRDLQAGVWHEVASRRDHLWELLSSIDGIERSSPTEGVLPHNLHVTFPAIRSTELIKGLFDVACSAGSACSSANPRPSHVLLAMGISEERALRALRMGLGRDTSLEDITFAARRIREEVARAAGGYAPSPKH